MDSIQQDPVSKSSLWNLISYFKKMTPYFLNVSTFFACGKTVFICYTRIKNLNGITYTLI